MVKSKESIPKILILFSLGILSFISLFFHWNFYFSFSFLLLVALFSIYYNLSEKRKGIGNWTFSIVMVVYAFLTLSLAFLKSDFISINFLAWSFISFVFFMIILSLFIWGNFLIKSKKLGGIIISYIMVSILLITFFTAFYAFSGDVYYKGEPLEQDKHSSFNYYYFSVSTFYSLSYGDFTPMKNSRIGAIPFIF